MNMKSKKNTLKKTVTGSKIRSQFMG